MSTRRKPTYAERTIKATWHLHHASRRPVHVQSVHAHVRKDAEGSGDGLGPRHAALISRSLKTLTDAGLLEISIVTTSFATRRRSSIGGATPSTNNGYVFTDAGKKYITASKKTLGVDMEVEADEARLWHVVARHFTTLAALQGHFETEAAEDKDDRVTTSQSHRRRSSLAIPARAQSQPTRRPRGSMPNMTARTIKRAPRRSSIVTAPTGRTPIKQTPAKGRATKRKRMESVGEDSDEESDFEVTPRPRTKKRVVADFRVAESLSALPVDKDTIKRRREELMQRAKQLEKETQKLDDLELELVGSDAGFESPLPSQELGDVGDDFGGMDDGIGMEMDWPDDRTETHAAAPSQPPKESSVVQATHSGLHTPPHTSPAFSPSPTAPFESHLVELEDVLGTAGDPDDGLTFDERRERVVANVARCVDIVAIMERVIMTLRRFAAAPTKAESLEGSSEDYFEEAARDCMLTVADKFQELEKEKGEMTQTIAGLENDKSGVEKQRDDLFTTVNDATTAHNATKLELDELKDSTAALNDKIKEQDAELADQAQKLVALHAELESAIAPDAYESAEQTIEKLKHDLREAQDEAEAARSQLSEMNAKNEELQETIVQEKTTPANGSIELGTAQADLETQTLRVGELKGQLVEAQAELGAARAAEAASRNEAAKATETWHAEVVEVAGLRTSLEGVTAEKSTAEKALKTSQEEHAATLRKYETIVEKQQRRETVFKRALLDRILASVRCAKAETALAAHETRLLDMQQSQDDTVESLEKQQSMLTSLAAAFTAYRDKTRERRLEADRQLQAMIAPVLTATAPGHANVIDNE